MVPGLFLGDHYFEVLARDDGRRVAAGVEVADQRVQVVVELLLLLRGQAGERVVHGAVPGAEHVDPVLSRLVAEDEIALRGVDVRCRGAKQLVQVVLHAPARWRREPRGRRHVAADDAEQLSDEPARRPVGQADLPAGAADAQQLAGRARMVGREHHAERRQHDIEGGVRKRQGFRVRLLELDGQALGRGAAPSIFEQRGHVVGGRDVAPSACGGQRAVAVAGRNVQHRRSRAQVDRLAKRFADNLQRRADDSEVAGRPRGVLFRLDRVQLGGWGGRAFNAAHDRSPCRIETFLKTPASVAGMRGRPNDRPSA